MQQDDSLESLLQQGLNLRLGGDIAGAERCYRAILAEQPGQGDALFLLAELAEQAGDFQSAQSYLEQAVRAVPDNALFHLALGNVQAASGSHEQAIASFQNVLKLKPELVEAHLNLGAAFFALGRIAEAEAGFLAALKIFPELAEAHNNLGSICLARNQPNEAERRFREALACNPQLVDAHANLASLLRNQGNLAEARAHFELANQIDPSDCLPIKLATMLPPVYLSCDELQAERQRLRDALSGLENRSLQSCSPLKWGGGNNFYLVYQGQDDKEIQQRLAQLYRRIYQPARRSVAATQAEGRRLKIGFVSSFFRAHTIGDLNRGIIANLSRDRFEVSVFSIGEFHDPVSEFIRQHADHYHALPVRDLRMLEEFIGSRNMDVLLYADIGMEPVSYFLAFSRLAPVQCATWGHPVTTGIDSIDYYISSEHQETSESQQYYSEKLVRLQRIPAYYYPPALPESGKSRQDFGLAEDCHVYLCPQSLFKLHPDFDTLLAEILRGDPQGVLVLMEGHCSQWTARLRQRFAHMLADVLNRVVFLPRLPYADYLRLMQLSDVMLDPLHFGGGKTTYDALSLGLPIVTLPGKFMRGRATYACYQQMGFTECVAQDAAEYVEKAINIGRDKACQSRLRQQIMQRNSALFQDDLMLRELEDFLRRAAGFD